MNYLDFQKKIMFYGQYQPPVVIRISLNEDTGKRVEIVDYHQDNFPINWGDGTIDSSNFHDYAEYGDYDIEIQGTIGGDISGRFFSDRTAPTVIAAYFNEPGLLKEYAFRGCTNLSYVQLSRMPEETSIPLGAFLDSGIVNYTLHSGIVSIGDSAFNGCTRFVDGDLLYVQTIGMSAFKGCTRILEANGESLEEIGEEAYANCTNLRTVDFHNVKTIGIGAFKNSGLTSITIPYGVTEVPDYMCYNCNNMTVAYLPESITRIGMRAFYTTSWEEVPIDTMEIYFGGTRAKWESIEKGTYWGNRTVHCIDD